jgi:hypothetical protein
MSDEKTIVKEEVLKKKRGRKPKEKYWTEDTESALVEYKYATDINVKNKIYTEKIHTPLRKLVYESTKRYCKFYGRGGFDDMYENAFIFIFNLLETFNENRLNKLGEKTKAFSMLNTICKNQVGKWAETLYNKETTSEDFSTISYTLENTNLNYTLEEKEKIINDKNKYDSVMITLKNKIEKQIKTDSNLNSNDIKVANSLISIFENWSALFPPTDKSLSSYYLKKKVFNMINSMTEIKNKDIKSSILKFKDLYMFSIEEENEKDVDIYSLDF